MKPLRIGLVAGLAFVLICIVALVGFVLASNATAQGKSSVSSRVTGATGAAITEARVLDVVGSASSPDIELAPPNHVYDVNPADFLAIPASTSVLDITLGAGGVQSQEHSSELKAVRLMTDAVEVKGDCGYVFVDLDSGKGLAYNAGKEMYVASAAKAPFVHWLMTSGIERDEFDNEEIQWVVEDSDNGSFEDLFFRYYENGYEDYMAAHDVHHDNYYYDFYPVMNARSLASVWAEIYQYLQGGSEDAARLAGHMSATSTSFIRDGLYDTNAVVMDKAGWIGEESWDYNGDDDENSQAASQYCSVSDAGIIQADGHTYLMVIVTNQFDDEEAEVNVSALARVLFDERASLQ